MKSGPCARSYEYAPENAPTNVLVATWQLGNDRNGQRRPGYSFIQSHILATRGLRWVFVVIGACLVVGLCFNTRPDDLESLLRRIDGTNGIQCAGKMIALSLPPVVGLGALMRRGAPTDRNGTALLVGIAGAAWGAFVFVFACPFNDPLHIAVWYSVGCGTVVLVARAILPRLSR
jgi:hypothetical protein